MIETVEQLKQKFEIKLQEYKNNYISAKELVDKQEKFDVSFEAEVEDEELVSATRELKAVEDVYNYIFGN